VKNYLKKAIKHARRGMDDKRTFFVGAVGIRADGAVVHSRNAPTAIPTPCAHAEARLTRKLGNNAEVVFVARYARGVDGWAMARPCDDCMAIMLAHKVRKIVYTIAPNEYGVINLQ
jgi:tRNA(Arg) A34 adenosine deaminase TadA